MEWIEHQFANIESVSDDVKRIADVMSAKYANSAAPAFYIDVVVNETTDLPVPYGNGKIAFVANNAELYVYSVDNKQWKLLGAKFGRDGRDGKDGQSIVGPMGPKGYDAVVVRDVESDYRTKIANRVYTPNTLCVLTSDSTTNRSCKKDDLVRYNSDTHSIEYVATIKGIDGKDGKDGRDGKDGTPINLLGQITIAGMSAMPAPRVGDVWQVIDSNNFWTAGDFALYDHNYKWKNLGPLTGGSGGSAVVIVDDLTSGGTGDALSAEQGKVLKALIDAIPEPVEVADDLTTAESDKALSANQGAELKALIDNIDVVEVVNDLTHDNEDKALSAKQGKILKGLFDGISIPAAVEVVNDLTHDDEDKALSAKQGKVLKGLVDGITIPSEVEVVDDLTHTDADKALSANQGKVLKGLVDAIPAPVDVVDSLTATDTDKALSANKGKELKDSIDAIPVVPALPTADGSYKLVITGGVATWETI